MSKPKVTGVSLENEVGLWFEVHPDGVCKVYKQRFWDKGPVTEIIPIGEQSAKQILNKLGRNLVKLTK